MLASWYNFLCSILCRIGEYLFNSLVGKDSPIVGCHYRKILYQIKDEDYTRLSLHPRKRDLHPLFPISPILDHAYFILKKIYVCI